jgi:hypothetical protein
MIPPPPKNKEDRMGWCVLAKLGEVPIFKPGRAWQFVK